MRGRRYLHPNYNLCCTLHTQRIQLERIFARVRSAMREGRLLLHGARQVVRVGAPGQLYKKGQDMNELHILTAQEGTSGLSVAVDRLAMHNSLNN